jgi:endonuclease YncB( thermonuclease family)
MRWPPWSPKSDKEQDDKSYIQWAENLNATDWSHYKDPRTVGVVLAAAIASSLTTVIAGKVYRSSVRRIPGAGFIKPTIFRKKSLFGTVTRVGDGDNFHLFHQPGGRLMGWGWMPGRRLPKNKADLKGETVCVQLGSPPYDQASLWGLQIAIRIAGIDAPEGAHFGKPSQPYSAESLQWLTDYILNRRVRAYIYRRDQYDRVVATVWVRRGLFGKDVGKEMLKAGLATVYEGKTGAEFGESEEEYRKAEESAKFWRRGMWAGNAKDYESPRDYKMRTAHVPGPKEEKMIPGFWRKLIWWK